MSKTRNERVGFYLKIKQTLIFVNRIFLVSVFVASCAPKATEIATECVTNDDQKNLFIGYWPLKPVPLAVEVNDFSAAELTQIRSAIETWNSFFQNSKGFQLFLSGNSSLTEMNAGGARMTYATACSTNLIGSGNFSGKIMIYKNVSGWTYGSSVMALTSTCPVSTVNSTYKRFISAVMEVNFQNYFISGKPVPDLQSIITHELGHVLGLNHSCSGSACATAPTLYESAIMYPNLGFNGMAGKQKRELNSNDQERANCLY